MGTGGFDKHYSTALFWGTKPLHSLKTGYFMMTVVQRQNYAIDANKPTLDLESFSEWKYGVRGTSLSIYRLTLTHITHISPLGATKSTVTMGASTHNTHLSSSCMLADSHPSR